MRVAVASGKGGTGRTLVATNLAWSLAARTDGVEMRARHDRGVPRTPAAASHDVADSVDADFEPQLAHER